MENLFTADRREVIALTLLLALASGFFTKYNWFVAVSWGLVLGSLFMASAIIFPAKVAGKKE